MNTESPTIDSVHSEILGPSAGIQADVGVSRAVDVHPSSANPQIPDSLARVARKKPRIDAVPQPLEVYLPKMFHLSRLPVELLAEILLYMPSTKSLLAVARCSRYLCATLVSSSSAFIWRNVRMSCNPPIPNPTPNFGEPAYASFIFDDGECEVCKEKTKLMHMSFALRARLCGKPTCRFTFESTYVTGGSGRGLLVTESSTCFIPHGANPTLWPDCASICRLKDYADTFSQLLWNTDEHTFEIEKNLIIMTWAVELFTWKETRYKKQLVVKSQNDALTKTIATKEGWSDQDLLQSHTYGNLYRNRNDNVEEVQMSEYEAIRGTVDAEIIKMVEARKCRVDEDAYRKRREEVEKHYNRIKSAGPGKILPTLAQFRQLPIIKVIQSKPDPAPNIAHDLKTGLLADLLLGDLEKWRRSSKEAFGAILGYPGWKSASKNKLHPVDRVTARFRCTRCRKESHKYFQDGCLDFAGACAHVCQDSSMEKRVRERWAPEQFEKDDKVIQVITKLLIAVGSNPESSSSLDFAKDIGGRIQCQSCESRVLMDFRSMMGHSHRHDDMQIKILSEEEYSAWSTRPPITGMCAKLLRPHAEAKTLRGMQNYGCRHCVATNTRTGPGTTEGDTATKPAKSNFRKSSRRLFIFNGLVSHVKEKHGILRVSDEDFFCETPLAWK